GCPPPIDSDNLGLYHKAPPFDYDESIKRRTLSTDMYDRLSTSVSSSFYQSRLAVHEGQNGRLLDG
ncbi:MAG: hypothetical protein EBY15_13505, partial [Gammaproteobacteria bacterium]|nr:hypothetical protein [Gammaproteobacteria bacterium]